LAAITVGIAADEIAAVARRFSRQARAIPGGACRRTTPAILVKRVEKRGLPAYLPLSTCAL
jgi:hypothetical protein